MPWWIHSVLFACCPPYRRANIRRMEAQWGREAGADPQTPEGRAILGGTWYQWPDGLWRASEWGYAPLECGRIPVVTVGR